jgi:hypothetical protein
MFTLQTSFKPLLLKGDKGEYVKYVTRGVSPVTVNSTEENSEDFCPNYVQEFGLSCNGATFSNFSFHRKERSTEFGKYLLHEQYSTVPLSYTAFGYIFVVFLYI